MVDAPEEPLGWSGDRGVRSLLELSNASIANGQYSHALNVMHSMLTYLRGAFTDLDESGASSHIRSLLFEPAYPIEDSLVDGQAQQNHWTQ